VQLTQTPASQGLTHGNSLNCGNLDPAAPYRCGAPFRTWTPCLIPHFCRFQTRRNPASSQVRSLAGVVTLTAARIFACRLLIISLLHLSRKITPRLEAISRCFDRFKARCPFSRQLCGFSFTLEAIRAKLAPLAQFLCFAWLCLASALHPSSAQHRSAADRALDFRYLL